MRRIALAGVLLGLALATPARADQPPLKVRGFNFGEATVGSLVSGTITAVNRTDEPVLFNGGALSAENRTTGWLQNSLSSSGSCRELSLSRTPLPAGAGCDSVLTFRPAFEGPFRASVCLFSVPESCSLVLGRVSGS